MTVLLIVTRKRFRTQVDTSKTRGVIKAQTGMVSRFACTLTLSSDTTRRPRTVVSTQTLAPLCLVQYLESIETTLAVRHTSGTKNSSYLKTFNSKVLLDIFETSCTFKSKHFNSSAKSMSRVQSD